MRMRSSTRSYLGSVSCRVGERAPRLLFAEERVSYILPKEISLCAVAREYIPRLFRRVYLSTVSEEVRLAEERVDHQDNR